MTSSLHKLSTFALFVALALPATAQTTAPPRITGFSPNQQAVELKTEADFKQQQNPARFRQHLERLCSVPHVAGSRENEQVRDYIAETMRKAGWKVDIYPHDIYLPKGPGEITVEVVTPTRVPINTKEFIFKEDKYASDPRVMGGWNAYAGNGDVTATVVYANYGRK